MHGWCAIGWTSNKGTPDAPPHGSYEGGVLPGIRVLGAFLGGFVWCRDKLVKRVRKALEPLPGILALRDSKKVRTAQQLSQVLIRFCMNTTLTLSSSARCLPASPWRRRGSTTG